MNPSSVRQRWGDHLVSTALGLAADRQRMERDLSAEPPGTPGVGGALALLTPARWAESVLLWVGFRLQPKNFEIR